MVHRDPKYDLRTGYRQRLLACTAGALLMVNTAVVVWPSESRHPVAAEVTPASKHEIIVISDVVPTQHSAAALATEEALPVAAPLPPVVAPDEIVPEVQELDLAPVFTVETDPGIEPGGNSTGAPGGTGDGEGTAPPPVVLVPPKPLRLVEPEYSREARRKRVKAEIKLEVLVDATGHVRQTKVLERYLLTASGRERVALLGYGLEEAAVSAASRWRFRPAQRNGEPIEHPYTLSITLGS